VDLSIEKIHISWDEIFVQLEVIDKPNNVVYGVPTGGMILAGFLKWCRKTHDPAKANLILDDIEDSGATRDIYRTRFPHTTFHTLIKKVSNVWIVFPWEVDHPSGPQSIQQNIIRQIQYIGEDPNREGLKKTPDRIVRSWSELFAGYKQKPEDQLTVFDAGSYDQLVLLKDVEIFSVCVVGSTFVEIPRGRIPIKYLKDGDWIYTVDSTTKELGIAQCKNPRLTAKDAQLVRVYADNDSVLCTPNHRFLTHNRGWVEAQDLQYRDSIVSFYRATGHGSTSAHPYLLATRGTAKWEGQCINIDGQPTAVPAQNHRIIGVASVPWREDVYCMDVPGTETFFANGMAVHNCEHHWLPFIGRAHVAYIPDGRVIGISKLARLVDIYARRLQIQERLGEQITMAIMEHLKAKGAACVIEAVHLCMQMRGISKQHSSMITSSLKGVFLTKPEARAELMGLIK
jgi:GTP cyclohydrolase I